MVGFTVASKVFAEKQGEHLEFVSVSMRKERLSTGGHLRHRAFRKKLQWEVRCRVYGQIVTAAPQEAPAARQRDHGGVVSAVSE